MSATDKPRTAIVTGAGRGIGRAMALGLLGAGHNVLASDIDQEPLDRLVRDTTGAGDRLTTMVDDVTKDETAARLVGTAVARFGRLDILINNAGVGPNTVREGAGQQARQDFRDVEPQDFRRILDVNTVAPFLMTREAVKPMLKQGWGRIINVTTSLDSMWRKGMLPYGGSKAANEAHCCIMAEELAGTGVTVNILVPGGPVNTRLVGTSFSEEERAKLIQPEVMVDPLLWLVTEASDGVTGQRFIAAFWDKSLPPAQAAEKCGAPMAWQQLGRQAIFPGGQGR